MATKSTTRSKTSSVKPDPRITQRRKQVKRSNVRKRLWIIGGLVGVVAIVVGGWMLLHTTLFSAKTVTVSGAVHEDSAQVIAAAGLSDHPALIGIDVGAAEAGVNALPWVRSSTVQLHWPSSVAIIVVERTPVASVGMGTTTAVIDAEGRVLALEKTPPAGLVSMTLPGGEKIVPGAMLGAKALGAVQVAATLPAAFKGQVATVVANNDGSVTLQLTTPVRVDMGTATHLEEKYRDIASVIAGATLHPGDVIDVSVPQASTITGP